MLGTILYYFSSDKSRITHKYLVHGTIIEVVWTIFPAIVLLAIAIPSFRLLYILDEVTLPTITIKATGFVYQDGLSFEYSIIFLKRENKNNFIKFNFSKNFNTIVRAKNRIGPHDEDLISVIFGLLLGDGYANNRTGEGVKLAVKQSTIHKEYIFLLYKFFLERGYCTNNPPRLYSRKLKTTNKIYYGYEFNTFTFRSFV